jgi:hypothetical protein
LKLKNDINECIHAYLAIKGKYPDAGGSSKIKKNMTLQRY